MSRTPEIACCFDLAWRQGRRDQVMFHVYSGWKSKGNLEMGEFSLSVLLRSLSWYPCKAMRNYGREVGVERERGTPEPVAETGNYCIKSLPLCLAAEPSERNTALDI